MNLTLDGLSDYVDTGTPDTFTPVSNGANGSDAIAENINGPCDAIRDLQLLLGNALTLKGSAASLVDRLSRAIGADGAWPKGTAFPVSPAPIDGQPFVRTDLNQVFIYDGDTASWVQPFDNLAYALLDGTRQFTGDVTVKKITPGVRLIGTEAGGLDYLIRENAGALITYRNTGTEAVPTWTADNFFFSPGDYKISGSPIADPGWSACDGGLLSQVTEARLFAKIGTTYNTGGEPAGQFRKPDKRGRGSIGSGQGAGLTNRTAGQKIGSETQSVASMATHNHGVTDPGHEHGSDGGDFFLASGGAAVSAAGGGAGSSPTTATATTGLTINNNGSSAANGNMPPVEVDYWYIKL